MLDQIRTRKQIVLADLRRARGERVASWDLTLAGGGTAVHSRAAELRAEGHTIICERETVRGETIYYYRLIEPQHRRPVHEAEQVAFF